MDKAEIIYRSLYYMEGEASNIEKALRELHGEPVSVSFDDLEKRLTFLLAFIRSAKEFA